jgi:hypothetical protein
MPRFWMGWRERLWIIPGFVWLNFSKTGGVSLSIHLLVATWNTRRGWYIDGPFGFYWRERRPARRSYSRDRV